MEFVDAHHHFWKIDCGIYDWISDDISGIRRDYEPVHLSHYLSHLGIAKTVLVQAAESLVENEAMLDISASNKFVAGVVAWVDLDNPSSANELESLAKNPKVKSIRPVLQGIEDSNWVLRPQVQKNISLLPQLGLCFDALIQPRHLEVIHSLSQNIPELRIVIDHAAKPVIANGQAAGRAWENGMSKLAQNPNIFCKLSGVATEQGPGWQAKTLMPISDHLLKTFGPDRLMWGSDWPVLELSGSYVQWFNVTQELLSDLADEERQKIMGKTATEFYGL
ncbi:MAG: amidohydrolase family protein [Hyphomicrobiales bacterium]